MKLRRTTTEEWGILRTVICIFVAVLIFLISFPSFAAEGSGTEEVPKTETAIAADENNSEEMEDSEEESKDENVHEESAETASENEEESVQEETAGENEEKTGAENVQIGYVTMKAVSGNTSITN